MTTSNRPFNGFYEGFQFIWRQTKKPIKHPSFVLYFLVAILLCGCMGVWYEWKHLVSPKYQSLYNSIILLTPPFISAAYYQIILDKNTPSFAKGLLGIFVFGAAWIFYDLIGSNFRSDNWLVYILIGLMTLISIWITWIQLSLNEDLYDKPAPKAAVGGKDITKKLNGEIDPEFER